MRKGFTLIEMLVVIGIIAILAGVSMTSFRKMTKTADRTKAQELVSEAATALTAIYDADGMWPKLIRTVNQDSTKGRLDKNVAYILAKRGYMSLSTAGGKLAGRDRFGILAPWAAKKVESSSSVTEDEVDSYILNFVVDLDGDGKIDKEDFGKRLDQNLQIRATAAVWCYVKGKEADSDMEKCWIKSWTKDQSRKIK